MFNFPEHYPADFGGDAIPEPLQELVNAELSEDETIQWIDQPIPSFFASGALEPFFFGIPWTAFSVFWTSGAAGVLDLNGGGFNFNFQNLDAGRLLIAAFGIPFVLSGLWMLSAPLRVRRNAKRTVYAITNYRAIIVQGTLFAHNIMSYYPADICDISRTQKADGTGSLRYAIGKIKNETEMPDVQAFVNIRNVQEVERILQELKGTK